MIVVQLIGEPQAPRLKDHLQSKARTHGLTYLAYLIVFPGGAQGQLIEVGASSSGPRQVRIRESPRGRFELHWLGDGLSPGQADTVLTELGQLGVPPTLSDHLHGTLCQSLTIANLHLELVLRSPGQASSQLPLVREQVSEAMATVRTLLDSLAGEAS